jgi:NAD(P)-dependent dehydrogenase (short-subunit alcohol dehydrogenase family)
VIPDSRIDPVASFRLEDRVTILTGASSGIGAHLAGTLAAAGAKVVVAARRLERLQTLVSGLPGDGHLAVACDMANDADLDALVAATMARHGRIDILINNAGFNDPHPAETEPMSNFRYVMEVNLNGTFALTQLVARCMLERGEGTIVNVASILGMVGAGQIPEGSYAASKGALVNLTRELAAQWARRGVRVNAVCPGWFRSEMTAEMFDNESSVRWIRRKTPMGRPGELQELDGAVLFLASPASSYVTGAVLPVDGGWTAV